MEHVFARRFAGKQIESQNRFIQYDPQAFFVEFEIPNGQITGVASYRVVPTDAASCRLISKMNFSVKGIARLFTPLLTRIMKRDSARDEQTLKRLLEA
ncbi:MAG: SRPBCC family protein [Armatimonadetes bacterium]|nr:SRPBCC family protein [Armatimonadota bacterium]